MSASRAATASFVTPLNQNVVITGSLINGATNITATGTGSHAEGILSQAVGDYSHAEGATAYANGYASHAEGQITKANGIASHAEGSFTIADGVASHAEGHYTTASGDYSHAEGTGSAANGAYSHAEGRGTIANAAYQHVQGAFNRTSTEESAFILGSGTGDAFAFRRNLIFAAGNRVEITGSLSVTGSITGSLQGTSTLIPVASSSISAGSIFFDTVENKLYIHNGTSWKTASLG